MLFSHVVWFLPGSGTERLSVYPYVLFSYLDSDENWRPDLVSCLSNKNLTAKMLTDRYQIEKEENVRDKTVLIYLQASRDDFVLVKSNLLGAGELFFYFFNETPQRISNQSHANI